MSNKFLQSFLTGKKVDVPVESEFPSTGFIGQLSAKMLWQVRTELDLLGPEFREEVPGPYHREQLSNGSYLYYYVERSGADKAAEMDKDTFAPQMVWYYSMPCSSVLNVDTSNFQTPNITRACRVTSLRSKYRHEFHLIALPACVAAVAKMIGYDVPEVDFGPLAVRGALISDQMSYELIGDKQDFEGSKLWQQRAEVWKALGENDPHKYLVDAVDRRGNPHKDCTSAEKLRECLGLYSQEWSGPLWAKLLMVSDPRPEAVSGSGNRFTLPAMVEVYESAGDAEKAKDRDLAEMVKDKPVEVKKAEVEDTKELDDDMPEVPAGWEAALNDWMDLVTPFTAMAKPVAKKKYDAEETGVDFDLFWAWVEYLKKM